MLEQKILAPLCTSVLRALCQEPGAKTYIYTHTHTHTHTLISHLSFSELALALSFQGFAHTSSCPGISFHPCHFLRAT